MNNSLKYKILFIISCLVFTYFLSNVVKSVYVNDLNAYNQDFTCYYYAAITFSKGLNPYVDEDVIRATSINLEGVDIEGFSIFPYKYSPPVLYVFRLLNIWDYRTALKIWTILKLLLFLFCLVVWLSLFKDYFLKTILILLCMFGFNQCIFQDFWAGNISIFEIFAVTIAVIFLLRNKVFIYCSIIFLLALFKVQVLLLIFLPLVNFEVRRVKVILTVLLAGGILFYIYSMFEPGLVRSYFEELFKTTDNIGEYGRDFGILMLIKNNYVIYALWITFLSAIAYFIVKNFKEKINDILLISFGVLIYGLIVPRFVDYSFGIMVVPAVYGIKLLPNKVLQALVCIFVCTMLLGNYSLIASMLLLLAVYLIYFFHMPKISIDSIR